MRREEKRGEREKREQYVDKRRVRDWDAYSVGAKVLKDLSSSPKAK